MSRPHSDHSPGPHRGRAVRSRLRSGAGTLVLAAMALAACAAPAHMGPPTRDVIAVTGRGEVSVRPDVALVQLGASARSQTLADATADVAGRMTTILERVRAAGVRPEDVTTVRYGIDPLTARRPDGEDDPTRIVGYLAANVVQLKVRDVTAVGRVVDAAVTAGANVIHGVRFTLEDREAAEARARDRAVAAAQVQAAQLARAAGVRLGPLVSLTEGPSIRPFEAAVVSMQARGAGPVEAGETQVVVTVEAQYRIDRPAGR